MNMQHHIQHIEYLKTKNNENINMKVQKHIKKKEPKMSDIKSKIYIAWLKGQDTITTKQSILESEFELYWKALNDCLDVK